MRVEQVEYIAMLAIAGQLLRCDLITPAEYSKLRAAFVRKIPLAFYAHWSDEG